MKLLLIILVILFAGCSSKELIVNSKSDLIKVALPNKEILIFSQACASTKSDAIQLSRHNFSLQIVTNINSAFSTTTTVLNNNIDKKSNFHISEKSSYNNIIGAKYYYEPLYFDKNKKRYCVDIYYDFDYFHSFEKYAYEEIIKLNSLVNNLTYKSLSTSLSTYGQKKNNLLFYYSFYKSWAEKYTYSKQNFYALLNKVEESKNNKLKQIYIENIELLKLSLNYTISSINAENYLLKKEEYNIVRNNLHKAYINIKRQGYIKVIPYKYFTLKNKEIEDIIKSFYKSKLYSLKQSFIELYNANKVVKSSDKRKDTIQQLLAIKAEAESLLYKSPYHFSKYKSYFNQHTKKSLYSRIRVRPTCKFHFNSKVFLQNVEYKIINTSYDSEKTSFQAFLYIDENLKVTNKSYGYLFKSSDYGMKTFKLEIISTNKLKDVCSKTIEIKKNDIKLTHLYIDMEFNTFKSYVQKNYNGIEQKYPHSFFHSALDSRSAYKFDQYYALFLHNKLNCIVLNHNFDKKKISCRSYKNKTLKIKH